MIILREKIFRKDYRQKLVEEAAERAGLNLEKYVARQRIISTNLRTAKNSEKAARRARKIIGDDLLGKLKKNISDHKWSLRNKRILAELPEGSYKTQVRQELGELGRKRSFIQDRSRRADESSNALESLQKRIKQSKKEL